jgi:uncharacterized protein YbbK (DUF523 family)
MTRHYFLSTALALLVGIGGITVVRAVEPTQPALAKKELKTAITNAKTPQDHQRIAAYYQKEADRMLAEAKEHDELAIVYAKSPNASAMKMPMSGRTAEHCKYFAEAVRKAAQESQEMAKLHQEMARQAQ